MQIRTYIDGAKEFCDFDWEKFVKYLADNPPGEKTTTVNRLLERALSAATESGKKFTYATIER